MSKFWRKVRTNVFVGLYCIALFALFDFAYSTFFFEREPSPRARVPRYSHGLLPNYDGFDSWGTRRYRYYTNNLGFRDGRVRDIALNPSTRRVLLIGDSFTEGLGMTFEESFAGRLYRAGQERSDPVEFLNAGALSYSPIIFYRKIEWLLACGLKFDEVVLFSDLSDVNDEATDYFDLDDDPNRKIACEPVGSSPPRRSRSSFIVTHGTIRAVKHQYRQFTGRTREFQFRENLCPAWTIPGFDVGDSYAPLGIEGGIERSRRNMERLADLLAERGIPLSIVVYPWPMQLAQNDRDSRQVVLWREFCTRNCKLFINTFPTFFAVRDSSPNWYERLFIYGDCHFSVEGNRIMSDAVAKYLL